MAGDPPTPPYTEATVSLIFDTLDDHALRFQGGDETDFACNQCGSHDPEHESRMVAEALVKAGLLLPEGAETRYAAGVAAGRAQAAEDIRAHADDEAQRPNRKRSSHLIEDWLREAALIAEGAGKADQVRDSQ